MNEELQKAYDEVDRMLQPGKAFRTYPGKSMSEKMHVRARVDGDQVVTRRWFWRKQRWDYRVECLFYYALLYRDGQLKEVK